MAKNSVADWDATAANNTDVGGIDINEGCPAANLNNAVREVMAQVKTYSGTVPALSSANTFTGVNTYTKIQKWAKGADVASASTLTLGDDGNYFDITGTTAITAIATKGVGTRVLLQFDAALTLTHHATDLILPGGLNITTAAGDHAEFVEYATGDWRCVNYVRAADTTLDVASATTTDIGAGGRFNIRITGTTTITGLGTSPEGTLRFVRMAGALTLTHNGTSLILPGSANITTAANDCFIARSLGSGNWLVMFYQRASSPPGGWTEVAPVATTSGAAIDWTSIPSTVTDIELWFSGVSVTGTDSLLVQIGTGGSPTTSGYSSGSGLLGSTSGTRIQASNGLVILSTNVGFGHTGRMSLHKTNGNTWVSDHNFFIDPASGAGCSGGGSVSLAGALDNIRLTRQTGSQTFDAGSVKLRYR